MSDNQNPVTKKGNRVGHSDPRKRRKVHTVGRAVYHKFHAVRVECDGIKFPSKKQRNYYLRLKERVRSGEVVFFLREAPMHLPGGVRYVVDFVEFHTDGTVHFVDVKGVRTTVYKTKKRLVEAVYPVEIEER